MSDNAQTPDRFDNSRINPDIRRALRDHDPEVQQRVKAVSDAPATPSKQVGQP